MVEDHIFRHMQDLYGLNPNIPHRASQFPRLPPGLTHPMFNVFENPMKRKLVQDSEKMSTKLQGFQRMYQSYAASLFQMNSVGIIPPGHPLYNRENSVDSLRTEKDKLQKENIELRKQLEKLKEKKHN